MASDRESRFPLGATVTVEDLTVDPHPVLRRLRETEAVSWIPSLDAWLVTSRELVLEAMRDAETFTVDDPRFSTAQVIGPSMLSTDGSEHDRHRDPFGPPFRLGPVRERFTAIIAEEVGRRIDAMRPAGGADLRTAFSGPVAVRVVMEALGIGDTDPAVALSWYDAIVESVSQITAGGPPTRRGEEAFSHLRDAVGARLDGWTRGDLSHAELVSNAAVLMFGGIETTDAMIALAVLHLLSTPDALALVRAGDATIANAVEESLRLEPAASVIDRFATRDVELGGAAIGRGELVRLSLAGANRDPAFFLDPDRFDVTRDNARHQVAFAQGSHVCLGMHLARLETQIAVGALLERIPDLRLDPGHPAVVSGLVFRKPATLHVVWDAG